MLVSSEQTSRVGRTAPSESGVVGSVFDIRLLFLSDRSVNKKLGNAFFGPLLPETINWAADRSVFV